MHQPVALDLLVAQRLDAELGARRVEDPDDDLLAEQRGQRADAEVDRLVAELQLQPPVLRHALLGNVHARDDLDARGQLVLDRDRRLGDLAQLAVDAKAHPVVVLVGLEVQVGGARVDRVDQHLLQEAHHRRVFDFLRDLGAFLAAVVVVGDVELEVAARQRLHGLVDAGALGFEEPHQLVVLDDDPLGRQLRGELDAFDGFLVGGVGRADEQAIAALAQHHQLVLQRQLRVDDAARQPCQVDRVQVEQRQRQGRGQRVRQIGRLHGAGGDHGRDETGAPLLGAARKVFGGLGAELARMHEHAGDPGKGRLGRLDERVNGHRLDVSS